MAGAGGRAGDAGCDGDRPQQAGRVHRGAPARVADHPAGGPELQHHARPRLHRQQRHCQPGPRHRLAVASVGDGVAPTLRSCRHRRGPVRGHHGEPPRTHARAREWTQVFSLQSGAAFLMHFMFIYARRDPHPPPRRAAARCSLSFGTRATSTASPSWRDRHGGRGQSAERASLRSAPDSTRVIKHVYN